MITTTAAFVMLIIVNVGNEPSRAYSEIVPNEKICIQKGKRIKTSLKQKNVKVFLECMPIITSKSKMAQRQTKVKKPSYAVKVKK